jgi:hypothetical protein
MQQISLIPDHRMGFSQISVDLSQNRGDAVAASQPAAKFRLLHAFSAMPMKLPLRNRMVISLDLRSRTCIVTSRIKENTDQSRPRHTGTTAVLLRSSTHTATHDMLRPGCM